MANNEKYNDKYEGLSRRQYNKWKNDEYKDVKGGINHRITNDMAPELRERFDSYRTVGGKPFGLAAANTGWGTAFGGHGQPLSVRERSKPKRGRQTHHNYLSEAIYESGFANIEDKQQLSQFLDKADAIKAKHGDFMEDGWGPEDILLFREHSRDEHLKSKAPAPTPAPAPVTKQPQVKPNVGTAEDSDHLRQAKELAQGWQKNSQNTQTQQPPEKTSFDKRPLTQNKKQYDFTNSNIDGDTKNV